MSSSGNNPQTGGAQFFSNHGGVPATFTIVSQATTAPGYSLPTDVPSLHSMINTLLELQATNSVNAHLAVCAARLQAQEETSTPTTATTVPLPCPNPDQQLTVASGRGAASPEIFQEMTKNNWHGRLGRTHMVEVDALPATALTELDSFLRRKLQAILPKGESRQTPDADSIFGCLAALGIRLEDRGRYNDFKVVDEASMKQDSTAKRARHLTAYYYANRAFTHGGYWPGFALETLVELARYRGLFDDEGFLKEEK